MQLEEYGQENEKVIVMLHGANFVHSFQKQYVLAANYHIIVPHLMGFGNDTERIFNTEKCVGELAEYIRTLDKKVMLVGFSLGAQLSYKLVSEHENLFHSAVLISPWLIKEEPMFSKVMKMNQKQFRSFKKKWFCNFVGRMNGLSASEREEFVTQMQNMKYETIQRSVDNGITLESVSGFDSISIPVIALAGAKEQNEVKESVKKLAEANPNCNYEIWEKAGHNIPAVFPEKLNKVICSLMQS